MINVSIDATNVLKRYLKGRIQYNKTKEVRR